AIALLAQKFQRPAGGFAGVIGLADDGHRARREQRVAEIHYSCSSAARKRWRQNEASKLRLNGGGSVGLTRSSTKQVTLASRSMRAPAAISPSVATVQVRLMPAPLAIFSRSTPRLVWLCCQPV